jgi:hypothetical protein
MLKPIHAEISRRALGRMFSLHALETIVAANRGQDALQSQIGHDEFHFDNNAFGKSRAYIEEQRALIAPALARGDGISAWKAFGRLTHSAQDFYAHSNYIDLWLSLQPDGMLPTPAEVDPLDADLLTSPALRSGKLYYPLEALTFVPRLKKFVVPLLPHDSHAWMNLDSAERGPLFDYAYRAAVKRTQYEYDVVVRALATDRIAVFQDIPLPHA